MVTKQEFYEAVERGNAPLLASLKECIASARLARQQQEAARIAKRDRQAAAWDAFAAERDRKQRLAELEAGKGNILAVGARLGGRAQDEWREKQISTLLKSHMDA